MTIASLTPQTHQECSNGCSGRLTIRPGVFGSSIVSGSGGLAEPSMLNDRAFARRAVMASRLGMFLYPAGYRFFSLSLSSLSFSVVSVSWFSFSSFSVVRGSPLSPTGVVLMLWGGDVDRPAGDVERVLGGFTAIESAFDTVVDARDV